MSGTLQSPAIVQALLQARLTGRPVPIPGALGLAALPNGSIGTPGGGFGGGFGGGTQQSAAAQPQIPTVTATAPTPPVTAPPPVAPVPPWTVSQLNQPTLSASGVPGLAGTPSGPPMAPTYDMPPAPTPTTLPTLEVTARRYRVAHGMGSQSDADALNAQSLAAAQAGRTYWNPALLQPGQPVLNALTTPPVSNPLQSVS